MSKPGPASGAGDRDGPGAGGIDLGEVDQFLAQVREHTGQSEQQWRRRSRAVHEEIDRDGTYRQTTRELTVGARLAWYNHTRCIGKLYWRTLQVRDHRDLSTADQIADALLDHLRVAGNGGAIRPVLSVFAPARPGDPGPRVHNSQLVRYAGHRQPDGAVLGDPATVAATDLARSLGWQPAAPSRFDVLPLLIQLPGQPVVYRPIPPELVLEVPITHPDLPAFAGLGLRWYGYPTVSDMRLRIGGIEYPAAPFSGWYLVTEIAARNLADRDRYDLLPTVAEVLGLDTSSNWTLWRDRALVELAAAVLSSYHRAGVRMVDHHTSADQFHRFHQAEQRAGRTVHADWTWIVPPMAASTTAVFHMQYPDAELLPNFFRCAGYPGLAALPATAG